MNISLCLFLIQASDKELMRWSKKHHIDLTYDEINQIRFILKDASFGWVTSGIPKSAISQLNQAIGEKRVNQLLQLIMT